MAVYYPLRNHGELISVRENGFEVSKDLHFPDRVFLVDELSDWSRSSEYKNLLKIELDEEDLSSIVYVDGLYLIGPKDNIFSSAIPKDIIDKYASKGQLLYRSWLP